MYFCAAENICCLLSAPCSDVHASVQLPQALSRSNSLNSQLLSKDTCLLFSAIVAVGDSHLFLKKKAGANSLLNLSLNTHLAALKRLPRAGRWFPRQQSFFLSRFTNRVRSLARWRWITTPWTAPSTCTTSPTTGKSLRWVLLYLTFLLSLYVRWNVEHLCNPMRTGEAIFKTSFLIW